MEKDIDIAEILKDKPIYITKLWSPLYGDVFLSRVLPHDGIRVVCQTGGDEKPFFCNGKFTIAGEVCLFPSRNMRDWSKYTWKKGDVLKCTDGNMSYFAIFEAFEDEEYATFKSRYNYVFDNNWLQFNRQSSTNLFIKVSDVDAKLFIKEIENYYGGKLNLETLNIENPKQEFKDGDILYMEVGLHRSKYIFIYCKDNEEFIPTHYCFLNLAKYGYDDIFKVSKNPIPYSIICDEEDIMVVRLATGSEKQQLFDAIAKENKAWDADKKQIVDLPKKCEFKPFDKVLVRNGSDGTWRADIYSDYKNYAYPHNCIGGMWEQCIPYNDQTAHLLGTTGDWKGGEV